MLNFAERPDELFKAPLKTMKLAPVTEKIHKIKKIINVVHKYQHMVPSNKS